MKKTLFDYSIYMELKTKSQIRNNSPHLKKKISSILFTMLLVISFTSINATNYYVSNSGNDSNLGTSESSPWKTVAKVNASTFKAGDQILFKRGDVWRENFVVSSSGSSGNPIVFGAYGTGANPIITGANVISGFSNGGNNIWDATVTSQPRVVLKSRTLQTNAGSRAAIKKEGEWHWSGNTLSVYATSNPSGNVEAGIRTGVMSTNGRNYLTFKDITFECSNGRDMALVNTSYGATENSVQFYNCVMQYSAGWGIYIGGNTNGAVRNGVMDGCIVRNNWGTGIHVQYDATNYSINNCKIYSNGLDPVTAGNGIWGSLGNFTISKCDVYDNGRGLTWGPPHGIYHYISSGTVTIENCNVYSQPQGSGVRLRGDGILRNNAIYNNAHAGINMDQNASAGETYTIIGNLIYGNKDNAVIVGGSSTGSINLTMYNNTVYHNGKWALLELAFGLNKLTLKNNIFYATSNYIMSAQTTPTTRDINYNVYYRSDGNTNRWRMGSSYPTTLSAWQALKYDANGYYADPLLISPPNNLKLQSGSPAIEAGVHVGLIEDFIGNPIVGIPDIGAYEYQSLQDVTKPVITSFTIPATSSSLVVPISSFTATDNKSVTGFKITESATTPGAGDAGWITSAPTSYTFSTAGTKTLYAWVKDEAGNVSVSVSVQVLITLPDFTTHKINIAKGWNIISSYLIPSDRNMESVMVSLRNNGKLVKVEDQYNNTYERINRSSEWVNNIGDFQITEGYRIQVNSNCALEIRGPQIELPLSIQLKAGWNIISFPVNGTVDAMKVIKPLIDAGVLYKVQDEKGNSIEQWRNRGWINRIGNFEEGKGYIVQVSSNAILTINEPFTKSTQIIAENPTPTYFKVNYDGNGIDHMNINIVELGNSQMSVGDELAVFDNDICVGAVKLTEQHFEQDVVSIPASASEDGLTNGYSEGNSIKLKVWKTDTNEEINLFAQTIEGEMFYNRQASVFLSLSDLTVNVNESLELGVVVDVYPNPASQYVNVRFMSSPDFGTSIELFDISGRNVINQEIQSDNVVIRLENLQSGIYFIKIPVNSGYLTRKLVKK